MLRLLTTFFLLFGIILMMGFPWVLRARPPHDASKLELQHYSILFGTYLTIDMLAFIGSAICAILMVRQVRRAYSSKTRENLEELVESALRQHQRPGTKDES